MKLMIVLLSIVVSVPAFADCISQENAAKLTKEYLLRDGIDEFPEAFAGKTSVERAEIADSVLQVVQPAGVEGYISLVYSETSAHFQIDKYAVVSCQGIAYKKVIEQTW